MTPNRPLAPRGALLLASLVASGVVVCGAAGTAHADSRGTCIETSAVSAPTSAALALDEDGASLVAGTGLVDGAERGGPGSRRAGGNPAWCENGDAPQCATGSEAPTRDERVNSTDAGATLSEHRAVCAVAHPEKPGHPPIRVGTGATGQLSELDRPPRLG